MSIRCDQDNTHVALLRCNDCGENFCAACDAYLHKSVSKSKHRRVAIVYDKDAPATVAVQPPSPKNVLMCDNKCSQIATVQCEDCGVRAYRSERPR